MKMINRAKYLSLLVLLGAWGCTTNQYASKSGGSYDDLYGGNPGSGIVSRDQNGDQDYSRSDNPDYSSTQDPASGTSDYYDETYLSSRGVRRALSPTDVGYNAGFVDGYNQASRYSSPFNNGLGSFWPGSSINIGFGSGFGGMYGMRPYLGFGLGMGSMMGYSPWGYGSMLGYSPFGYSPFGSSPFGYGYGSSMYGYGMYDSYYGGFGGYGYNPWAYSYPVVVVNNNYERQGLTRTYGPRGTSSSRNSNRYNQGFVNNSRSNSSGDRNARRSANSVSGVDTYSSPRTSGRGSNAYTGGRTNAESNGATRSYSRGAGEGNDVYYSRPRSSSGSNYSSDGLSSGNSSRGSRNNSSYSAPSYSSPSRSQSNYSTPSRSSSSYNSPGRSTESYSAPSRSYSSPSPSYSAPSRSYSAPSAPSGGGGGGGRSSSRGPR